MKTVKCSVLIEAYQVIYFREGKILFIKAATKFNTLHTAVSGAVAKGGRDLKYFHFWMRPVYSILYRLNGFAAHLIF